jgi:hypothetical protein
MISAALMIGASSLSAAKPNRLTKEERKAGWKNLFNGKNTNKWRNFNKEKVSDGWSIVDGAITRSGKSAGDILTKQQYGAFELMLDYKISKGGNSGLMFHVSEDENTPWKTGPEIQIQDNVDGHDPQLSGWLYQLYKPDTDATKPAGEWNTIRFLLTPEKGALWMNGVKYYEFVKGSDHWNEQVAKSKFKGMPKFGKLKKGHICLQDHGNEVAFRNLKIRDLSKKK